ncbi:hypothetical protein [Streptomyces xantholiticus]|uniref:hypothetical protein n=1 Tax=Streptomyces xantholiticus TaxID=68285 RepID=UPI0016776313|nr:hypothetical protein [Streptomyces xantholiticus]
MPGRRPHGGVDVQLGGLRRFGGNLAVAGVTVVKVAPLPAVHSPPMSTPYAWLVLLLRK